MTTRVLQLASLSALALGLAATASADVKLNDNLSLGGYVIGLADSTSTDESETTSTMDIQATKLWTKVDFAPVSGTVSLYAGSDNDPKVLDAFFTYDLGGGLSVTGGKFLSWLGYEAFDPINMINISYAWQGGVIGAIAGIPGYHTGVKIETSSDTFAAGFAVLDSNESNFFSDVTKGDGDLDNGAGLETYVTFKGKALTVFVGAAYNSAEAEDAGTYYSVVGATDFNTISSKSYSVDLWVQYVTGDLTLAGEFAVYNASFDVVGMNDIDTYFFGVWAKYAASDKLAYVGRVAGGEVDSGDVLTPTYMKYTFSPIITLSANLELAGEVSYITYDDAGVGIDSTTYVGLQARFKF